MNASMGPQIFYLCVRRVRRSTIQRMDGFLYHSKLVLCEVLCTYEFNMIPYHDAMRDICLRYGVRHVYGA